MELIERNLPYRRMPEGKFKKLGLELLDQAANFPFGTPVPLSEERLIEIENRGFDPETVQRYIDQLSLSDNPSKQKTAAMLRGAFNDLLSRIPDAPELEDPSEVQPAA